MRELVAGLREGGIAPTADGRARGALRSPHGRALDALRLERLPRRAARLARALAVLERADPAAAGALAELDADEAAAAADALVAAGILAPGRPAGVRAPDRARGPLRRAAGGRARARPPRGGRLLRDAAGPASASRSTCWPSSPRATRGSCAAWSMRRAPPRAAGRPSPPPCFLRRALAEPPPATDGRAPARVRSGRGQRGRRRAWSEHLRAAIAAAPDGAPRAAVAARARAWPVSREQRRGGGRSIAPRRGGGPAEGNERSAPARGDGVVAGTLDAAPRRPGSARAATRCAAGRRPVGAPRDPGRRRVGAVVRNEPAEVGAELARRAIAGEPAAPTPRRDLPPGSRWRRSCWSGPSATPRSSALLEAPIVECRAAGRQRAVATALTYRAWLALRRGDLRTAEVDARTGWRPPTCPCRALPGDRHRRPHRRARGAGRADAARRRVRSPPRMPGPRPASGRRCSARARPSARGPAAAPPRRSPTCCAVGDVAVRIGPGIAEHPALALGGRRGPRWCSGDRESALARRGGAGAGPGLRRAAGARGRPARHRPRTAAAAARRCCGRPWTLQRRRRAPGARPRADRPRRAPAPGQPPRRGARAAARRARHRPPRRRRAARRPGRDRAAGHGGQPAPRACSPAPTPSRPASGAWPSSPRDGMTNREIAQSLFVTARTVEGHLTARSASSTSALRDDLAPALDGGGGHLTSATRARVGTRPVAHPRVPSAAMPEQPPPRVRERLRELPSVDRLADAPWRGPSFRIDAPRCWPATRRTSISWRGRAQRLRPSLRRVLNATGVVVHTNLGRAPLAPAARAAVAAAAEGYSNLELDLATGERGSRHAHVEALLREVTGAQAAMAVNNCAAAVLLAAAALAGGRARGGRVARAAHRDRRLLPHPRGRGAVRRAPRRGRHHEPHAAARLRAGARAGHGRDPARAPANFRTRRLHRGGRDRGAVRPRPGASP